MTLWHEELSDGQIQALKDNERPYSLLPEWQRYALDRMGKENRERVNAIGWAEDPGTSWKEDTEMRWGDLTYRLRPDWKRPEKEQKKEGRWEYWEIHKYRNSMMSLKAYYGIPLGDQGWTTLSQISSLVGFGGIEFEEWPDQWFMSLQLVCAETVPMPDAFTQERNARPATPKRVRFWVEK